MESLKKFLEEKTHSAKKIQKSCPIFVSYVREREKLISPLPRVERRISSSDFLSRRPFGYYLPIASYGTIFAAKWSSNGGLEAVVSKQLAQGHKGLTTHRCFLFCFSSPNELFFVIDHTTKLGMKDLLKDQQW